MLAFQHPISVCITGGQSGDLAARLGPRLSPHRVVACATLDDATRQLARSASIAAFDVLPASLDDEVRNYEMGDLYVKVRPSDPSLFLTQALRARPVAVVVLLAGDQTPEALRADLAALPPASCQRLLVMPESRWREGISLVNAGFASALQVTGESDDDGALEALIGDLIGRHFADAGKAYRDALAVNGASFIDQASASVALDDAKRSFCAAAHCVSAEPPGVLMMTERGQQAFLLICDDDYETSCASLARAQDAGTPAPAGFAEASAIRSWHDVVASSTLLPQSPRLRTSFIPQTYDSAALFDQIIVPPQAELQSQAARALREPNLAIMQPTRSAGTGGE